MQTTTLPPSDPARPDDDEVDAPPPPHRVWRRLPVAVALLVTFLLFAACATWLIYRGATIEVPDSMFVLRGAPAWEGAEATVDGIKLARAQKATLSEDARYTISFHIVPGDYSLAVRHKGAVVFTTDFELTRHGRIAVLQLPPSPEGLSPASRPANPRLEFREPWSD